MGIPGTCYDTISDEVQFDVWAQMHDGLLVISNIDSGVD